MSEQKHFTAEKMDQLLAIASEHMFFETLETRNSDSLDFKDVAVWAVRDALIAAFNAGVDARQKLEA